MEFRNHKIKLVIGILIGAFFLYLAGRRVNFAQMLQVFETANHLYILATFPILFFSHLLRALRWRYLLDPIKRLDTGSLFSSLIIGYMANVLMPAHLGEILRAYVLSKKRSIAASSAFATIVVERILDVFTLLVLMVLTILVHPFPSWLKNSGYIMLGGTLGLLIFLILLKKFSSQMRTLLGLFSSRFSGRFQRRIEDVLGKFVSGIVPLKSRSDYAVVGVLSVLIWVCYGFIFYFCLYAFDLVRIYHLPWSTSLVLLVVTTIAVVIPSSPGYVGTFHYLCQISLALFGVPAGQGLSFAVVVHAINFLPVLVVGLVLSYSEGVTLSKISEKKALADKMPQVA